MSHLEVNLILNIRCTGIKIESMQLYILHSYVNIRTVTEIIIKQSGSSVDDLKLFIQGMAG